MASIAVADRKATEREIREHAHAVRSLVATFGLANPRLRSDGTVVVHSDEPGYRAVLRLSAAASGVVGAYVHVITDDSIEAELAAL
jgi:hypothetical protein